MVEEAVKRKNPFVGPRPFTRADILHGRERETDDLFNLLISGRILLMYSPSGAGKTSLIQAALIPRMLEEGFSVLDNLRVNSEPESGPEGAQSPNRYLSSVLSFLEDARLVEDDGTGDERIPESALAEMGLDGYLRRHYPQSPSLLIFDQFEEILTLSPVDVEAKRAFFEQVGQALQDPSRWALFAMREEFIAGLDPYLNAIPTRFSATFRLELLSPNAASQAIQRPARIEEVTFTDKAAGKLVDDLRAVRVMRPDGSTEKRLGVYVEPVQLQVVCHHLWDRLQPPEGTQIVVADLEGVGDADRALAAFYADRVAAIAADTGTSERVIRDWIDGHLITEQGIRGQVLQGPERSRKLDNRVIWRLVDAHLVRAEDRRGATWFELAHDRLIEPVRADNAAWREKHLGHLQRQAALWQREGRRADLLLRGPALVEAERWAADHEVELTDVERDFLAACRANLSDLGRQAAHWTREGQLEHLLLRGQALVQAESWAADHAAELTDVEHLFLQESRKAQKVAEQERRQNRRIRWLAVGASLLAIIAFGLFVVASLQTRAAQSAATAEAIAKSEAEAAVTAEATAREGAEAAVTAEATAREGAEAAATGEATALELAIAAVTEAVAAQQTAEADRILAVTSLADAEGGLSAASTALAVSQERSGMIQALEATNQVLATQLTPTPSTTPEPTNTLPPGSPGPSPSPTRTSRPTATSTSTPNWTATTAAEATAAQLNSEQLEQVWLTQTAVAQSLKPTVTPVPVVCLDEPQGEFQSIWKAYKDRLGCPLQIEPTEFAKFAEQQFERGFMFWAEKPRDLILAVSRGDRPTWYERRAWSFDADSAWCASTPPPGLVQPIRGLGGAWCDSPEIREALGWAVETERAIQGAVQEFDNGFIMRTGDPTKVYVLFRVDRTYAVEAPRP